MLTDLGRRILGHLPTWYEDESWVREEENLPEDHVRGHAIDAFAARMAEDPPSPDMSEPELESRLGDLADAGLCENADGHWKMTEAGLQALQAPVEDSVDQEPGAVFMELHPGKISTGAEA